MNTYIGVALLTALGVGYFYIQTLARELVASLPEGERERIKEAQYGIGCC